MLFKKCKIIIFIMLILSTISLTACDNKDSKINTSNQRFENLGIKYEYSSGVLLGFRKDEKNGLSSYRTMWISPIDGKLKLVKQGKGILMPYGMEFWQIEQKLYKFKDKTSLIEYLDVHPADKKISKEQINKNEDEKIKEHFKLNFVGNKYVSIKSEFEHKNKVNEVMKLDKIMVTDVNKMVNNINNMESISLKKVFKKDIIQQFIDKNIELNSIKGNINNENLYDQNWGIFREKGKWVAKFAKPFRQKEKNYYHEGYNLINIPYELPQIIKCYDELMFDFESIKEKYQEAVDIIASPKKDIIIIITPKKVFVYPCTDKITGNPAMIENPVLIINKESNESLIMSQWATDQYVDKWNNEVVKYLK